MCPHECMVMQVYRVKARGQCWVFSLLALHFVFPTGSKLDVWTPGICLTLLLDPKCWGNGCMYLAFMWVLGF